MGFILTMVDAVCFAGWLTIDLKKNNWTKHEKLAITALLILCAISSAAEIRLNECTTGSIWQICISVLAIGLIIITIIIEDFVIPFINSKHNR